MTDMPDPGPEQNSEYQPWENEVEGPSNDERDPRLIIQFTMGLKPHRPSDYPSFLLYILDETHLTITALNAAIGLYTRDAHVLWVSAGALLSSLSAKGIKHFIREPRPPPPPPTSKKDLKSHVRPKKTFGMPSTHSTALSFYFFYLVPVFLLSPSTLRSFPFALPLGIVLPGSLRHLVPSAGVVPRLRSGGTFRSTSIPSLRRPVHLTYLQKLLSAGAISLYWIGGVWSRVELGYHTYAQVWAGVALGWLFSSIWRGVWLYNPGLESWLQAWLDWIFGTLFQLFGL